MTTPIYDVIINDVDKSGAAQINAGFSTEEILGATGQSVITIQSRDGWEPTKHDDIKIDIHSSGWRLYHGEILTWEVLLPVGEPFPRYQLTCADYNGELPQRLIGALDGRTWEDGDGFGDYIMVEADARMLSTDAETIKNLFDVYMRIHGQPVETDTYVDAFLAADSFLPLKWLYTNLQSSLDAMAAMVGTNVQYWLDPDDSFHWKAIPAWQDVAQEILAGTGGATSGGESGAGTGFGGGSVIANVYGSAMALDTKANLRVGDGPGGGTRKVSHRFKAAAASPITSLRFSQRGGSGYSSQNGVGGSILITIQGDNGSGQPDGVVLASVTYSPSNPTGVWTRYDSVTFSSPYTPAAGEMLHAVFANTSTSGANYISVNEVFVYGAPLSPRQPAFADADYAVLTAPDGTNWTTMGQFTAVMDVVYASGAHSGQAYIGNIVENFGVISGSNNMVRETIVVSGGDKTVDALALRLRRSFGTGVLTAVLENSSHTPLATVTYPAASIPISAAGGDTGGAVWVNATFTPVTLTDGATYYIVLSCAGGTEYTAACILQGDSVGFGSFAFRDGAGQMTTNGGSSWVGIYAFDNVDIQFALGTEGSIGGTPSPVDSLGLLGLFPEFGFTNFPVGPATIDADNPDPGRTVSVSCRNLKWTEDGTNSPEQVYVRGGTGFVYDSGIPATPFPENPPAPIPQAATYTLVFNRSTKIYSRTSKGYVYVPGGVAYTTYGVPYGVVPISIPRDPSTKVGGAYWLIKDGPIAGKVVPQRTAEGVIHVKAGTYNTYTVSAGNITGLGAPLTTGGFFADYELLAEYPWPTHSPKPAQGKLLHVSSGVYSGKWLHATEVGVVYLPQVTVTKIVPPTPDPPAPPVATIAVGGSGWVGGYADPDKRQAYLDEPNSTTQTDRDSVGNQALYRAQYPVLRGSLELTAGTSEEGEYFGPDGYRVGQLIKIIDARMPARLNSRYFVIQRVQTKAIQTQDVRIYTLDWGDGPTARSSGLRQRKPATPPPADGFYIDVAESQPQPGSTQVIKAQLINGYGAPWAIPGKTVNWLLICLDESWNPVEGQGFLDPPVSVTDDQGIARTVFTAGPGSALQYFIYCDSPVVSA